MKLEFVEIAGFRGFRDKTRFDLAVGFTVLSGRNGTGKSTLLDAVEFAIAGTISKFSVKAAKGGGLDEHIWWLGSGKAEAHYVTVGFVGDDGNRFAITRSRERGADVEPADIMRRLCSGVTTAQTSMDTLIQTTLIRDELIASLSLDLPEQARFATVRAAIGGLVGPDYSERTESILAAATAAKNRQEVRIKEVQNTLGRSLSELTETRSIAERSSGITDALQALESLAPSLPASIGARTEAVRRLVADQKIALREIEGARLESEQIGQELAFFNSPEGAAQIYAARVAQEDADRQKALAQEHLALATRLEATEKESDEYAAHLAAIIEDGSAVGLQDGHCPLCDAVRTADDFEKAIASAKARLAVRGQKLAHAKEALAKARSVATAAEQTLAAAHDRFSQLEKRRTALEQRLAKVRDIYARRHFNAPPEDPKVAQGLLFAEQEKIVGLERALAVLENSSVIERVKSLETRIAGLREQSDQEAAKLAATERAIESARQIDTAAKTVENQILTEQFDTVMPLLKELYRRLRPHADWTEIESDFGGKVRGSLNFVVGDGYNPQFLFSSGQRRAAGLAFLLAVHLSRPWCTWRSLLLDDPVQHIDDYRALNLVEVLTAIRRNGRQVIVAVEDTALADVLCRRLRSVSGDTGRHFQLRTAETGTAEIASKQDIYPMPRLVLRPARAS